MKEKNEKHINQIISDIADDYYFKWNDLSENIMKALKAAYLQGVADGGMDSSIFNYALNSFNTEEQ
jgi:hypothetical protein